MDLYLREGQGKGRRRGGGGSKPEYPKETPDNQSEDWYHVVEVKMHCPNQGSNVDPLTLVKNLLGQNAQPAAAGFGLFDLPYTYVRIVCSYTHALNFFSLTYLT